MRTSPECISVAIPVGKKFSKCHKSCLLFTAFMCVQCALCWSRTGWEKCDDSLGLGQVMCPSAKLWMAFALHKAVESRGKGIGIRRRAQNSGRADCF